MTSRAFPPRTLRHLIYYTLIPVIVCELALSPFWFAGRTAYSWLPDAQELITSILLPVYLACVGTVFIWLSHSKIVGCFSLLISAVGLSVFLHYAVWGVSTGRFWRPDYETLLILRLMAECALAIALLPPLLALAVRYLSRYARRHA